MLEAHWKRRAQAEQFPEDERPPQTRVAAAIGRALERYEALSELQLCGLWITAMVVSTIAFALVSKWVLNDFAFAGVSGGFPYPITWAAVQMGVLAVATRTLATLRRQPLPQLDTRTFLLLVIPISGASAAGVVCTQASLLFIDVSLYTMATATGVVWLYIFGVQFKVEPPDWTLGLAALTTAFGLALSAISDTSYDFTGVCLAIVGSACFALKWVLTEKFLVGRHAFAALFWFTPPMFILGLVASLTLEVPHIYESDYASHPSALWLALFVAMLSSILSGAVMVSQIMIVEVASSLTLGVVLALRDTVQVVAAGVFLHEELAFLNACGLLFSVMGTVAYQHARSLQRDLAKSYSSIPTHEDMTTTATTVTTGGGNGFEEEQEEDAYPRKIIGPPQPIALDELPPR